MVPDSSALGVHVAFATPKRIGPAVVRNRVRRQVRALMRAQAATLPRGWYLIGIEAPPVDICWGDLSGLLATALPRAVQRAKHQTPSGHLANEVL
jgi:RNase P protein component